MYDITAIRNYILYLKTKCDLSVSLHMNEYNELKKLGDLRHFGFHDNSYCVYVKTRNNAYCQCCLKQSEAKLKSQSGFFHGICYAGVQEYVYPIQNEEETIGFVCVSGYQCENATHYLNSVAENYDLDYEKLSTFYSKLKTKIPPKEEVDTLIYPLCEMLELAYIQSNKTPYCSQNFAERVARFLDANHTKNISSRDVCEYFHCSRSYMSREFNRYIGKTMREYLTELRIKDALVLLKSSSLSVSEIAFSVGFNDSNYFSSIFKAHIGISPQEYRKNKHNNYAEGYIKKEDKNEK